ncbi:MAG: hypothetical protein HeimC3_50260 [Candidatus Heimdallarchaeota archaeon LC_3]|nr:MAG: hypothetical protein HeimC3_50260 [Candidatus Heimdallarchaeota archaeon LC_3]
MLNKYTINYYSWTSWLDFLNLEEKFIKLLKTIPPDDQNLGTWSPRLADLLIIVCTRLDSFLKACLRSKFWDETKDFFPEIYKTKKNIILTGNEILTIKNYESFFNKIYKLHEQIVYFKPRNLQEILPFNGWQPKKPPDWWTTYNSFKHDFFNNMKESTLNKVIYAFAGYFLCFIIHPETISTFAYSKKVLKVRSLNLPSIIPSNDGTEEKLKLIKTLKNKNPKNPAIKDYILYLKRWVNALPPYPDIGNQGALLAESKLFMYLYRTKNYEQYKKSIEFNKIDNLLLSEIDSSPI